jgi:hypothetical protein
MSRCSGTRLCAVPASGLWTMHPSRRSECLMLGTGARFFALRLNSSDGCADLHITTLHRHRQMRMGNKQAMGLVWGRRMKDPVSSLFRFRGIRRYCYYFRWVRGSTLGLLSFEGKGFRSCLPCGTATCHLELPVPVNVVFFLRWFHIYIYISLPRAARYSVGTRV